MNTFPPGAVAVIFVNRRSEADEPGYSAAAEAMERAAERQPGYLGIDSVRAADGQGITVSYWASEEDAIAWRDDVDHAATRAKGRDRWYDSYRLVVAGIRRDYAWRR